MNYRGSAGFGQDMVEGLCGRVGDQDVKDVQVSCVSSGFRSLAMWKSHPIPCVQLCAYKAMETKDCGRGS